jgi:hypothetical protein
MKTKIQALALSFALLVPSASAFARTHHHHYSRTRGTVVGAAGGALLGGPAGAVVGGAVGNTVQRLRSKHRRHY